jgi:hypothetical protein
MYLQFPRTIEPGLPRRQEAHPPAFAGNDSLSMSQELYCVAIGVVNHEVSSTVFKGLQALSHAGMPDVSVYVVEEAGLDGVFHVD